MLADDLLCALDRPTFMRGLGVEPDPWQERALRTESKQSLWCCSRQAGKSTVAALFALHQALYYPGSLVLLVSPTLRQSGELFRKVMDWVDRMPLRPAMDEESKLFCTLSNGSRIISLPGSEGTVRGYSAVDLVIEDESSRVDDLLYFAVRPMLATSGGRLILMSTPYGTRGHFYSEWRNGVDWDRIEVPATECPRISKEFLEGERRTMGERWYSQEYGCQFVSTLDQVFDLEAVNRAITPTIKPLFKGAHQ